MAARLDSVARYICEAGNWKVTNLQLQKILYLAQMFYMGESKGDRLVDANFQAWEYGPVEPSLYRKVRMFGSGPIKDVFYNALDFDEDDPRRNALDTACKILLPMRPGELVDITHWHKGAWAKNYVSGIRGISITDDDILEEYRKRSEP